MADHTEAKGFVMRQALEMALEFIERVNKDGWILADFEPQMYTTITAIKKALLQTEVTYTGNGTAGRETDVKPTGFFFQMPPQRTWVGLDNDDLIWIYSNSDNIGQAISNTETKLKEKNNG